MLITLGIIGIVAAMTIPTLIAEYQEKKTVTQLTKVYSTLSNAYRMMQAEYGEVNTWGMSSTVQGTDEDGNKIYDYSAQRLFAERLKKYLKVLKTCQVGDVCYPYAGYSLSGIKTSDENRVETAQVIHLQRLNFIYQMEHLSSWAIYILQAEI